MIARQLPLYEGLYLLGTYDRSALISKRQIRNCQAGRSVRCSALARPARAMTRFALKLGYLRLDPDVKVSHLGGMGSWTKPHRLIGICRESIKFRFQGQAREIALFVRCQHAAPLPEGKVLEDPVEEVPTMSIRDQQSRRCADTPELYHGRFRAVGDGVAINGEGMSPANSARKAERLWPRAWHWPARSGRKPLCRPMKSRALYEKRPAVPFYHAAHRRIEQADAGSRCCTSEG